MLVYLWLSLLLIKASGICDEECNDSDTSLCSRCLSHLAQKAPNDTNFQSHLICNLWDSPECGMGPYNIKVDQEHIKIEFTLGQKEILITKLSQELKITSTEFIVQDEGKMKDFFPSQNLTIPYYSALSGGEAIQNVYYDNSAWSTSGSEYLNYTNPEVSSRVSHTSLFSDGIKSATSTSNNTTKDASSKGAWERTFYYICSLAGGYEVMAFIFIFIDSKENKKLSKEKLNTTKVHNKIAKEISTLDIDKIESEKPILFKRNNGLPESPDNMGQASLKSKRKIVLEIIVKSKDKNEDLKSIKNDYKIIADTQNVKEINNDTYLKTPSNPLTAYYFISPFFFYMPFFSRLSRSTLLIFSLLLQAFFNGIFILLYESGVSSSKDYEFIEIFQDINYIHIIFSIFSPAFSNILAITIGWIFIKRRSKKKSDIKEALKQETNNRILGIVGYLLCLAVIGFVVVASYWITQKIDGNGDMMWMVMVIISLLCDIVIIQVIKVIMTYIKYKREAHCNN